MTASTFSPCPTCSRNMEWIYIPKDRELITIPFTGGKQLVLRDWSHVECICYGCEEEKRNARYEDIYSAGQEQAYKEGLRDGLHRR